MAQSTIDEDITRLELYLTAVREEITEIQSTKAQEEGGGNTRFSTIFTDVKVLYRRESELQEKLDKLYLSKRFV